MNCSKAALGLLTLLFFAAAWAGCGGNTGSDACQHYGDCSKSWSADDETGCEAEFAAAQVYADAANCDSQLSDVANCEASASCSNGTIDPHACDAESNAFDSCIKNAGYDMHSTDEVCAPACQ